MNKKVVIVVVLIVILVGGGLAWAFMGNDDSSSTDTTSTSTAEQKTDSGESDVDSEEATSGAVITFTNDGFTPGNLTVKTGTIVTVKNDSSMSVQFSSDDHPSHRLNTEMNLKTLSPGEVASFTATTVGTHGFHDHIDDQYTGTLVVTQ